MTERTTHPVNPDEIRCGDIMSLTYYVEVKRSDPQRPSITVDDLDHAIRDIEVHGEELIRSARSADRFHEVQKITKTRAAELLIGAHGLPFTVAFRKSDGSERKLRGRLIEPEPLLGRSLVEDLDIRSGNRVRQVDHRTIRWMILDGVRYDVKD
jgi:hypothetical protein